MQRLAALPGSTADLLCDLGQVIYPLCLPSADMDKMPAPRCSPRGTERAGVVVEWRLRVVPCSQGHVPPGAGPSRGEGKLPDKAGLPAAAPALLLCREKGGLGTDGPWQGEQTWLDSSIRTRGRWV